MRWHKCERTEAGRKVFSRQFVYCRKDGDGERIIFSDGGLAWFKSSLEGAKKFFNCLQALDVEISNAVEESYQTTLYKDNRGI